jgi:hypothetical protein
MSSETRESVGVRKRIHSILSVMTAWFAFLLLFGTLIFGAVFGVVRVLQKIGIL